MSRLLDLSKHRQLRTDTPENGAEDQGRLIHSLDGMFRSLSSTFVERWKRRPETVTASSNRPTLKWGELTVVDPTGSTTGELMLYLPRAKPSDAGRRIQFVKKYISGLAVRLVPADGSLINTFPSWGGMFQAGLHEIWWDGEAWWVKEPGARILRHGLEHQPLGLWQFNSVNGATDFSGHGRDLTVESGAAQYAYLHPSITGFRFNGATTLWYNVADADLRILGALTFEALLLVQAEANDAVFFAHNAPGETEDTNQIYGLRYGTAPTAQWRHETTAAADATANLLVPFTVLHSLIHLAVTRDSSNVVRIYINGRLSGTSAALAPAVDGSTGRFLIGGLAGGAYTTCVMTSAKLIGRALSGEEVAGEYNRTMGPAFGFIDSREAA
jgi:hypothetical protein